MSARTIRVLHVEDDPIQRRMIAHHLKVIPECAFTISAVASEELAVECFRQGKCDLVLLDYQLVQGDGMHLLGRLRELDPIVPIIAISGMASADIAARLIQGGADDYFNKRELNSADLAKSIRASLGRAGAVRKTLASRMTDELSRVLRQLTELCADYVNGMGPEFLEQLEVMALAIKKAHISAQDLQRMHEQATASLEGAAGLDQERLRLLARPLLLELLVRVYDDPYPGAEKRE